jgi:hypothetical protein
LLQRQRPHAARLRALGEAIRDDESLRREIEKGIQPRRFFVNGLDEGCAFFCLLASVQPEFLELCIYCMWAGGI